MVTPPRRGRIRCRRLGLGPVWREGAEEPEPRVCGLRPRPLRFSAVFAAELVARGGPDDPRAVNVEGHPRSWREAGRLRSGGAREGRRAGWGAPGVAHVRGDF